MTTEPTPQPETARPIDHGEPWAPDSYDRGWTVYTRDPLQPAFDDGSAGDEYGQVRSKLRRERIVQCVNACAGIPDPAAAIQAARSTLEQCRIVIGNIPCKSEQPSTCDCQLALDSIEAALATLTPTAPTSNS